MSENQINWGIATEGEEILGRIEREKLAHVRVFDPKELVRKAKQIREIVDEDLGTIKYVFLSYNELSEIIEKHKDNRDRSLVLLHKQLAPANEGLTLEDVKALPYEVVVRLLTKLQTDGSFFPKAKTSPDGSVSAQSLRK